MRVTVQESWPAPRMTSIQQRLASLLRLLFFFSLLIIALLLTGLHRPFFLVALLSGFFLTLVGVLLLSHDSTPSEGAWRRECPPWTIRQKAPVEFDTRKRRATPFLATEVPARQKTWLR